VPAGQYRSHATPLHDEHACHRQCAVPVKSPQKDHAKGVRAVSDSSSLRITHLSVHAYVDLPTFLTTVQSAAAQLVCLRSLRSELDNVIMGLLLWAIHAHSAPSRIVKACASAS
jgi:hypothetical protein